MGLIFDEKIARFYKAWYNSPQGRAFDRSIEQLIMALLDPRPGERLLDIGCGHGNHLLLCSRLSLNLNGIDASPCMIQKAGKRLGHICTFKTGIAEDLPFDDNEFDLAILINTLEFLDNPLEALREAGRVAKRKVFVGVINGLSWNGLVKKMQGYLGNPLFSHATFYNLLQIKSLLKAAYGPVPVSWGCIKTCPPFIEGTAPFAKNLFNWEHFPFGFFLGISATMVPRMRTDNLPLKARLKRASQTLMGPGTLEDLNRNKGVHRDETGIHV